MMDNPTAIVPNHDYIDDSFSEGQIYFSDENPSLGLLEIPWNEESVLYDTATLQPSTEFDADFDTFDPFEDPMLLDILHESNYHLVANVEAAVSGTNEEWNDYGGNCSVPQIGDFGNRIQNSVWPPVTPSSSLCCGSCQILREITHTNGLQIYKLEIHGSLGMISHAVLEKYDCDFSSSNHECQIFDFCEDSTSNVKQFLVQYFEDRKHEGYIVLQDPLWDFYEALGVGIDGGDNLDINSLLQLSPTSSTGDCQMNQQETKIENEAKGNDVKHSKIPLSAQRERTGKLRLKDFAGYLHLPIEEAAKKMNICPTVMKKICRRDGLLRWPYRKIKSIKRKIAKRAKSLSSNDADERASAEADILKLEQELAKSFEAFVD